MSPDPKHPTFPRHLRRPLASYITLALAVLSGLGFVAAGLIILSPSFVRWVCFAGAPLPVIADVLIERMTWRAQKARALKMQIATFVNLQAARGKWPPIEETPSSWRTRRRRDEPDRLRDIGRAEVAQEQAS